MLLVDLDPQEIPPALMALQNAVWKSACISFLTGEKTAQEAIVHTQYRVDLIPSNIQLSGAGIELVSFPRREARLREALTPVIGQYDFIFYRLPPFSRSSHAQRSVRLRYGSGAHSV